MCSRWGVQAGNVTQRHDVHILVFCSDKMPGIGIAMAIDTVHAMNDMCRSSLIGRVL
jgi:hypothetical protein